MPTIPSRARPSAGAVLRGGARAELSAVADAVLGSARRHELSLLDVGEPPEAHEARPVDVVWAGPDDVSRLNHTGELGAALRVARARLRAGGLVLLPAPEPAELKALHAVAPVAVQLGADGFAGPVGVWDFIAGGPRSYSCHLLELECAGGHWSVHPAGTTLFEVPTESELREGLVTAGFQGAQRLSARDTAGRCAVWAAVAPSRTRPTGT